MAEGGRAASRGQGGPGPSSESADHDVPAGTDEGGPSTTVGAPGHDGGGEEDRAAAAGTSGSGEVGQDSGDDDSSVRVVDDDSPDQTALRERLRQARLTARGRRHSRNEAIAATVAAYGMWSVLRRARRRKVETTDRFRLRPRARPEGPEDPEAGVKDIYSAANCSEFLDRPPASPDEPPAPEEEAHGDGPNGRPPDLPLSMEWWKEEYDRQKANPFLAGRVETVGLDFLPGMRPSPPPGQYFSWGPTMTTSSLPDADRNDFLRILAKDLRAHGLSPCRWEDIDVATPVHLVRHPVTLKPRITHDSRAVNVLLRDMSAVMGKASDALLRGTVAAKVDLLMAFRHVGLEEQDRRVLGFVVDGRPFRWNALTFGCAQSPAIFAAALARSLRTIQLPAGAAIVVYVDDILIVAEDREGLDAATRQLCRGLADSGWYVALDKAFFYAMCQAPFLGLIVNLTESRLQVSRRKADRLRELCLAAIAAGKVTLAHLQKIGGLLAFLRQAAPECGLSRHGLNAATAEAERTPGRTVVVKGRLAQDLVFWRNNATRLPDLTYPSADGPTMDIATDAAGLPSLAYGGLVWEASAPTPDIDAALGEVQEWRQNPRDGVVVGGGEVYAGPFPLADASFSSSALETGALRRVLRAYRAKHGNDSLRGKVVRWLCDSTVATGAVERWRAKSEGLLQELNLLLDEVRAAGCRLRPEWVSREAGWQPVVDALSKARWTPDTAEWRMAERDRVSACLAATSGAWSAPEIDLFGTATSTAATAWVSLWPELGAAWTDAFARPWRGVRRAWAFPPFSVAGAALRHACCGDVEVVIVIPRSSAVPARLRDCRRVRLPDLSLVDAEGHQALGKCPVALDAIYIAPG